VTMLMSVNVVQYSLLSLNNVTIRMSQFGSLVTSNAYSRFDNDIVLCRAVVIKHRVIREV